MPDIALTGLTKRYAAVTAVDDLTAQASAGRITAFLGANGSGKTTTMRMLLGLSEPDSGSALIGGRRYRDLPHPSRVVGAVLDQGFHPHRSARNHLRIVAAQAGVSEPLQSTTRWRRWGSAEAARRWVGGFSLGMRQRLNLAAAIVAGRRTWCSTSRSTASTPRASSGCAGSCARSPTVAAACCSPATCSPRSPTVPTTRSSSTTAVWSALDPCRA